MCFSLVLHLLAFSRTHTHASHPFPNPTHASLSLPIALFCVRSDASQWAKLELYSNLALVLGTFVGLVSAMTLTLVLARGGAFKWPWELYWVQTVGGLGGLRG